MADQLPTSPFEPHNTVPLTCVILPDKEIWSAEIEGSFDKVKDVAATWITGEAPPSEQTHDALCDDVQAPVVTQSQLSRREGAIGELKIAYAYLRKVEQWTIDTAEISKDIRTWLTSDAVGMTEQEAAPELSKIAQWEAFKESGDYVKWQNFVYDEEGHVLSGNTLTLAIKIMKGISCYTVYAPILTRITQWNCMPPIENEGCIDVPAVRDGWYVIGEYGFDIDATIQWLKTGCRSHPNGDGTYTLTEQWTGADEIDGDLYPTSNGDQGGE